MKRKFLAVIPARAGSKRIPHKNIRLFNGHPLIYYSIRQALDSGIFDRVIVDTDNDKIADISRKYGAETPFLRPKKLANDAARTEDVLLHLLKRLKREQDYIPDVIAILQTTSPFRDIEDIKSCYQVMSDPKIKSVCTICATSPWLFQLSKENKLVLINKENSLNTNTKKLKKSYVLNGCMVYMIRNDVFMKTKKIVDFINQSTVGVVCPKWRSVDLDYPEDWILAEFLCKHKDKIKKGIKLFK